MRNGLRVVSTAYCNHCVGLSKLLFHKLYKALRSVLPTLFRDVELRLGDGRSTEPPLTRPLCEINGGGI